jgi:glucose dehydrogenase
MIRRAALASTFARHRAGAAAVALLLAVVVAACGTNGDEEETTPTGGAPAPAPAVPPEVEQHGEEWPLPNRTYDNARAAAGSAIDSSNVGDLEVAWGFPLEFAGDWGAAASTPLIINGVVYMQDLQSNVFAIDLETGAEIWRAMRGSAATGPNGPAVGWGRVYAQSGEHHLFALDLETGEQLWETVLDSSTGTHQPHVYAGYVYTGTGAGEAPDGAPRASGRVSYVGGSAGWAYGIDHETGEILWSLRMVEEGFWGNPELNSGGALWYPPAVDTETGVTYWGTGNPAPFPGTIERPNATSRPGDNLYSNALVAVDGESGEMLWYNQVKPFDLFDLDFQGGPILAQIEQDGDQRPIVIGYGKLGEVYGFDRESGETLWVTSVGVHRTTS